MSLTAINFNDLSLGVGKLVTDILATDSAEQGVELLTQLFQLLTENELSSQDNGSGPTGLILSSKNAALCLLSFYRTKAYWQGVADAVDSMAEKQSINIVYPGPGPMASLVLPLWLAKKWRNVHLTLLEYNQATAEQLQSLLGKLGIADRVQLVHCDASQYKPTTEIDILVMECMTHGLKDEGQFIISNNLCKYLSKEGVLIPESIRLELHFGLLGQEFEEIQAGQPLSDFANQTRVWSQHLMSLDKTQTLDEAIDESRIYLGRFELPKQLPANSNLFISTNITTFEQYCIPEFSCGLTVPYPVTPEGGETEARILDAYYRYDQTPGVKLYSVPESEVFTPY